MLRTVSVLVAGTLLGLGILLVLFLLVVSRIPATYNWFTYFALKGLVGAAVGLFVGLFQKKNAGLVAMACLVPGIVMQLTSRSYPLGTGLAFVVFFLSESLGLLIAFASARQLSYGRSAG